MNPRVSIPAPALALALALALAACASRPTPPPSHPEPDPMSDTLYLGPRFVTPSGDAHAVQVSADGVIRATFRKDEPLPALPRRHLPGALALPGLIDAHLHVAWLGRVAEQVDLSTASSAADARARVHAFAAANPQLPVIQGTGWDQTRWAPPQGAPTPFPHANDLGGLERPVVLTRVDGHAFWLNRAAMRRVADLLAQEPPVGTRILRDAAGPTGIVIDPPPAFWDLLLPAPSTADLTRWLSAGLASAAAHGLVEVHDMATSPAELAALAALNATQRLPVRVVVYLDDSEPSFALLEAHPGGPHRLGPDLWVAGVKLFADGALGSRGAALKDDYSDEHGHRGLLNDPESLTHKAVRAARLGFPVAIHAIGDRANLVALEAIAAANAASPVLATARRLVHRVEHAQVLDLADLDRFAATGAIASMQPIHALSDMRWAEARVGPDRIKGAYAWNTLLRRQIPLAFGSDAPVEPVDPLMGLHAAITRQTASGEPPGGWYPSEALGFSDALDAFTAGAVRAAPLSDPHRTGRLEPGARFELTLLERDPRSAAPRTFIATRVLGTHRGP